MKHTRLSYQHKVTRKDNQKTKGVTVTILECDMLIGTVLLICFKRYWGYGVHRFYYPIFKGSNRDTKRVTVTTLVCDILIQSVLHM